MYAYIYTAIYTATNLSDFTTKNSTLQIRHKLGSSPSSILLPLLPPLLPLTYNIFLPLHLSKSTNQRQRQYARQTKIEYHELHHRMSRATHMKEFCNAYAGVMSRIQISSTPHIE